MFSFFAKAKKDKRGFTITELVITLAIMSLIAALLTQLMGSIWRKYRMVENLYIIQSEVQAIMRAFQADASTGSLATATNVDLFYEDLAALKTNKSFASCPQLGTFTENTDGSLYFPKRDTDNSSFDEANWIYTYLFVYNDYFYVLNGKQDTARRFKFTDEAKVNIKYEVSVDAFYKDSENHESATRSDGSDHVYLPGGVTITVESAPEYDFHYELHSSFSLKNTLDGNDEVNMNNRDAYGLTSANVAGYTKGNLANFPNVTNARGDNYVGETGVTYSHLSDPATVIKYISIYNFNDGNFSGSDGGMGIGTGCGISILMAGNNIGEGVKTTLRGFRDDVLKGNKLGEMIIDQYYNNWSPAIIEITNESPVAKKVLTDIIVDTAYLIEMAK